MTGSTVWHRRPEPEWCTINHGDQDAPPHRGCSNGTTVEGVQLSMGAGYAATLTGPAQLQTIDVCLEYAAREVDPHVVLSSDDPIVPMTLDEAEAVAAVLTEQVRLGRATQRGEDRD